MITNSYHIFEDVKNGVFQIRSKSETILAEFTNETDKAIFSEIAASHNEGKVFRDLADVKKHFGERYPEENILNVIKELQDYKIWEDGLPPSHNEQMLFWKNSDYEGWEQFEERVASARLHVIGDSRISAVLPGKARQSGFGRVEVSETPDMNSPDAGTKIAEIVAGSDFVIVDAENWNPAFLDAFNEAAYRANRPWLLIRGIADARASIGPMFIGRNTGCYHCLQNRLKSNMEFLPYFTEYEKHLRQTGTSSRGSSGPMVFYDLLADIAVLETLKFVSEWTLPMSYKAFLTIDLYTYEFKFQPFLKAPVCPVCSPRTDFKLAQWLEPIRLKNMETVTEN